MVVRPYSFIDIVVLEPVRQRFCAGDALLVLDTALDEIIWANGPGARLLGFPDFESTVGGDPALPFAARRQIQATRGYPRIGTDRSVAVRLPQGHASLLVSFMASEVALPDGTPALLLAAAPPEGETPDSRSVAERAISGLSGEGRMVAMVGADGDVLAASDGFDEIGMSHDMMSALAGQTALGAGRLVKRLVETDAGDIAAGIARLSDDPQRTLIMVVADFLPDEESNATDAAPSVSTPASEEIQTEASLPPADPAPQAAPAEDSLSDKDEPDTVDAPAPRGDDWYFNGSREPTRDAGEPARAAQPLSHPAVELGSAPVRFVWRTDADGRFSMIGDEFRAAVGEAAADVRGERFRDVAARFRLDPDGEIAGLLERRDTWSGRTMLWPIAGTDLKVPLDLAALPIYRQDRSFEGFRGFGVARMGDALVDPDAIGLGLGDNAPDAPVPVEQRPVEQVSLEQEPLDSDPHSPAPTASEADPFHGEVPALDVSEGPERRFTDKVIRLAERRPAPPERTLSNVERLNFREIGEKLRQSGIAASREAEDRLAQAEANTATQPEPPLTGIGEEALRAAALDDADAGTVITAQPSAEPVELSDGIEGPHLDETEEVPEEAAPSVEDAAEPVTIGEAAVEALDDAWPTPTTALETTHAPVVAETPPASAAADAPTPTSDTAPSDEAVPLAAIEDAQPVSASDAEFTRIAGESEPVAPAAPAAPSLEAPPETETEAVVGNAVEEAAPIALQVDASALDDEPVSDTGLDAPVAEAPSPEGAAPEPVEDESAPFDADTSRPVSVPRAPAAPAVATPPPFVPSAFAGFGAERLPGLDTTILSRLPIPLLVHSGDRLHYANREMLQFSGYATLSDMATAGGLDALFAEAEDDAGSSDRTVRIRRRDGTELPVDALLQSVAWNDGKALLLALRPIAVPAAAEASPTPAMAAPDVEARILELSTILDTATDGIVIIDNDGTVRSMSRAAEALFNMDSGAVAGRPFETLFAMESQRAAKEYLGGLAGNGVASVLNDGREVIGREAQGRFIPLFMTIGRLPNQSGYCAVMRDITQWKRAEEELTQARSQAERASSQKTDFLARVSHEIRTPLNAIIGFSELMMDEKFGPISNERYRDYLRDINKSGNHVLDLVNDLLDISKIEAGEQELSYEAVSLNDALGETVAMMQPQANRERVIIRSSMASRLPDVVADLRSVRQIAINLLSNAVRFTPAGGQVIVSTSYEPSGDIVMRVRDTGIGMSAAELDQALKPFKQVNALKRPRGDGTGLGLPLTKAMVEANRARFAIHSTPGEGTLVEIVFPSTRVLAH